MKQKYGICQWCLPVEGLDGCDAAAALGLDGMELEYSAALVRQAAEYRRRSEKAGIELPTIGMNGFCDHSYTCPEGHAFFVEQIKAAIDAALETGSRILQIPAFFASAIHTDEALKCAADCLSAACELARPYGIRIGTENALDRKQNLKLFRLVDSDNLFFYFDTQNLLQMEGLAADDVLDAMKGRLCEIHVKDCVLGANPVVSAILTKGETGLQATLQNVKNLGYQGWIHLENNYNRHLYGADMRTWQECIQMDLRIVREAMENE